MATKINVVALLQASSQAYLKNVSASLRNMFQNINKSRLSLF